jgi:hypothetical protein
MGATSPPRLCDILFPSNSKQRQAAVYEDKKRKGWPPVEAPSACVDTDEI